MTDRGHWRADAHVWYAPVDSSQPAGIKKMARPISPTSRLADALLLLRAEALDDMERTRIANENRLRALRMDYGLEGTPEEAAQAGFVDACFALERSAELELKREMRRHPLGFWVKSTLGVGEKQGARLIASIGDPYWNPLHDRPRTVSELWAYAGLHVLHPGPIPSGTQSGFAGVDQSSVSQVRAAVQSSHADGTKQGDAQVQPGTQASSGIAPKRARGQQANWNGAVKTRAYLVAESCMKHRRSPYRRFYDEGRAKYAESVHNVECVRCGPKGKPAQIGSPLSDGHKHARAMRLVMKEILRDLWLAARDLHMDVAA